MPMELLEYVYAFIVVGIAAGVAALMKRVGESQRMYDALIAGAIAGLVVLFAAPSVPIAGMVVAGLVTLGASWLLSRFR